MRESNTPMRAVVYTRVSTEEQAENGTSLEDQKERCLRFVELKNAAPVGVFVDAGVSGAKYETRPALQQALSVIEAGEAELLIVSKIDRLGRSAMVVLNIAARVDQAGAQIVTCDGMEFGRTPTGKLMLTQFAMIGEFERDMIRERMMSGKSSTAKAGRQPARAKSPYGYHIITRKDVEEGRCPADSLGKYSVVEEEAENVREIFALYDSGVSLRQIAAMVQSRSVPTPKGGKQWYASSIRDILKNPTFKGTATYGRKETVSGENLMQKREPGQRLKAGKYYRMRPQDAWTWIPVPVLVEEALWERCRARLEANVSEKQAMLGGNPGRKHTLTALVRCPGCDWRMGGVRKVSWGDKRILYFTCNQNPACDKRQKNYRGDRLEERLLEHLLCLHQNPKAVALSLREYDAFRVEDRDVDIERARLQSEMAAVQKEVGTVKTAMFAAIRAGLTEEDFRDELSALAQRRTFIEQRLTELSPRPVFREQEPETAAQKLAAVALAIVKVFTAPSEDFSNAEKQALLAQIVERIVPTEEGIEVTWITETVQRIKMKPFVKVK